jgi:hypothetical protein
MVDRHVVEGRSLLADGLSGSTPPQVYGTGRVCIEPSCTAKLSRYNSTDWCALHESPASTQRPYDTSTRPRGRRRNSSASRRNGTGRLTVGGVAAAASTAAKAAPKVSPAKAAPGKTARKTAA